MATPNAYQLQELKRRGKNPEDYQTVSQALFDEVYPTSATPATQPPLTKPETTTVSQVAPVDIEQVKTTSITERATKPSGEVSPEREEKARVRAEAIASSPFSVGGQYRPYGVLQGIVPTSKDADYLKNYPILSSLMPQTIKTPEVQEQERKRVLDASMIAAQSLMEDYQRARAKALKEKDQAAVEQFDSMMANLRTNADSDTRYTLRKKQLLETGSYQPGISSAEQVNVMAPITPSEQQLQRVTTQRRPGGELVESPLMYAGRLSASPVSAGVGLAEAAVTEKEVVPAVSERIAGGEGVMGAGIDIGDAIADAAGLEPSSSEAYILRGIGGGAGLLIDFMLPIVPGTSTVTKAGKAGLGAYDFGKALSLSTNDLVKIAGKEAVASVKGSARSIPVLGKTKIKGKDLFPEYKDDVLSRAITAYSKDLRNIEDTKDFVYGVADLEKAGKLEGWATITPEQRIDTISEVLGDKSDAFLNISKKLGYDVLDETGDFLEFVRRPSVYSERAALSATLHPTIKKKIATNMLLSEKEALDNFMDYLTRRGALEKRYEKMGLYGQIPDKRFFESLPRELKALIYSKRVKNIDELNQLLGTNYKTFEEFRDANPVKKVGNLLRNDFEPDNEILKQILIDSANRKIREVSPRLLPNYTRLTRNSFVPSSRVNKVLDRFSNYFGNLRDKAAEAIKKGDISFPLTDREIEAVRQIIDKPELKIMKESPAFKPALDMFKRDVLGNEVFVKDVNPILEKGLDLIASQEAGYKNLAIIASDLRAFESPTGKLLQTSMDTETYLSKVLKPKEIAGGFLETTAKGAGKAAITRATESASPIEANILSKEFTNEIGSRFGSIDENFKTKYRQARAQGKSSPDAWAQVISENYVRPLTKVIKKDAVKKASYQIMFEDYIAQIYGGYESMVDAMNATGRTLFLDSMLVNPAEMRQLVHLMTYTEDLQILQTKFIELQLAGNHTQALLVLRDAHALLQGKSINSFIKNTDSLKKLYDTAIQDYLTKVEDGVPVVKTITKQFRNGKVRQDDRGILEIWDNAKESAPMFLVDDHLTLLATQYSTRDMVNVVDDVYRDWSNINPLIFPRPEMIEKNAKRLEQAWLRFSDSMLNPTETLKKLKATFGDDLSGIKGMSLTELEMRDLATGFNEALRDEIKASSKQIYVALLEDQFTRLSSSEITSRKFLEEMNSLRDRVYEKLKSSTITQEEIRKGLLAPIMEQRTAPLRSKLESALRADSGRAFELNRQLQELRPSTEAELAEVPVLISAVPQKLLDNEKAFDKVFRSLLYTKGGNTPIEAYGDDLFSYLSRNINGDAYIQSIWGQIRPQDTPLFYNTLKTAFRQAAKSNANLIKEGVLEYTSKIPLTFGETAVIKKNIIQLSNIDVYTETMMELMISSKARKVPPDVLASLTKGELADRIEKGIEVTTSIREQDVKKAGRLKRLLSEMVGNPEASYNDGRFARIAKGGVLGGTLLPNFRYLTTNYMTAPSIIYGSLGADFAKGSMMPLIFDHDVQSTMRALTGGGRGYSSLLVGFDARPFYGKVDETLLFTTPTGRSYTNYQIADLASKSGLLKSQASAELTQKVAENIISFSQIESKKMMGIKPVIAGGQIKDAYAGNIKTFLKESIGSAYVGNRQMNAYSEMANLTDTRFRLSVLVKALKEGRTEQEALQLARESLFDYSSLTKIEKDTVNKIFWFWNFRRNTYRQVMKSWLTNPERFKNTYLANNFFAEVDGDYTFSTADYTQSRTFLRFINDKEARQRYAFYGPSIPMLQGSADLLDYMTHFPIMIQLNDYYEGRSTGPEALNSVIKDSMLGVISQSRPSIQFVVGMTFGVDLQQDPGKPLSGYLDPRFVWYLQQNDDAWATFQSIIQTEVVPPEEEREGAGYYNGRQYRIKRDDPESIRLWFLLQEVMMTAGLERNLRDYAPLAESIAQGYRGMPEGQRDVRLGGQRETGAFTNLLITGGVITPIQEVDLETRIRYNERILRQKLQ